MSKIDLIAGTWTTAGDADAGNAENDRSPHSFQERIEVAAKAGFTGVGVGYLDLLDAEEQYGFSTLKSVLADNGIEHLELEFLENWFLTDDRRPAADKVRADMLRAAEALGARHIKVGGDFTGGEFDADHMAAEFVKLSTDAANAGTTVVFEPMPFVNVKTPQQALEFIAKADHPAGGLLIDIWHVARAGVDFTTLAHIPAKYIFDVELDDAPLNFEGDIIADTFNGRRLPGEGELDVAGFVEAIRKTGYEGIYGVEILSAEYRKLPISEAVPAAYEATMKFLR
ncbi:MULTISPECIES: sugar phosphate isomerase/epimerase [unclassified Rhodococcus (in: high G+C Gram-positive bacteria)]|uniref:sugar phosphate isomerase/epimerase family protein n=1 Tax=unclassified Rhodococcus (in: high G+C Gram-positive bacteria) TaxID=192944 RepID=UPI00163AA3B2|nr:MULTISPECIES: sugar phosphate isomerase/epimerase [unclassified Rhodococcus (in: high G+C Gram-positive bacteria)]MBC2637770.1 sugar phosphate isomerase/epimerase [Rhodococcus sp. 3A]MBC2897485.1 sugar phosphate isomerase/epimerase [Rhodococcus sp. 4CII]